MYYSFNYYLHLVLLTKVLKTYLGLSGSLLTPPDCPWLKQVHECCLNYFCEIFLCTLDRGLPFIPHLDSLPNFNRSSDGPVRLPIVDKYKASKVQEHVLNGVFDNKIFFFIIHLWIILHCIAFVLKDAYGVFLQDMGTVILGKLESGSISKAQQLVMMPNRVRLW